MHFMPRRPRSYWRNLALFGLSTLLLSFTFLGVQLAHQRALGLVHPGRSFPEQTPSDVGIEHWRDVRFQSKDGLTLSGWYVGTDNGATVILVHGLGGNRAQLLDDAGGLSVVNNADELATTLLALFDDAERCRQQGQAAAAVVAANRGALERGLLFISEQLTVNS